MHDEGHGEAPHAITENSDPAQYSEGTEDPAHDHQQVEVVLKVRQGEVEALADIARVEAQQEKDGQREKGADLHRDSLCDHKPRRDAVPRVQAVHTVARFDLLHQRIRRAS
ncbi:MAG: hypothetical protein K0R81_3060 [Microbacterium sp.]|nr:hypothetical protein [Microbacterium sp.]